VLAVSAGLSADFSAGFSTTIGFSAAVFSIMAFSEMPLALIPGSGRLATSAEVSGALLPALAASGAGLASACGWAVETAAGGAFVPGLVAM
jgi:hypothetical protein